MSIFAKLFGGGIEEEVRIRGAVQKMSERNAKEFHGHAVGFEKKENPSGAKAMYEISSKAYDRAVSYNNDIIKAAMLRPIETTRITFNAAFDEFSKSCEAKAHQKLLGLSSDSEVAKSIDMRFYKAREALFALVFESDITEEELELRVNNLMKGVENETED